MWSGEKAKFSPIIVGAKKVSNLKKNYQIVIQPGYLEILRYPESESALKTS